MVLEAVYEQSFLDCSYGFRPGRSAHQALRQVQGQTVKMAGKWFLRSTYESFSTLWNIVSSETSCASRHHRAPAPDAPHHAAPRAGLGGPHAGHSNNDRQIYAPLPKAHSISRAVRAARRTRPGWATWWWAMTKTRQGLVVQHRPRSTPSEPVHITSSWVIAISSPLAAAWSQVLTTGSQGSTPASAAREQTMRVESMPVSVAALATRRLGYTPASAVAASTRRAEVTPASAAAAATRRVE